MSSSKVNLQAIAKDIWAQYRKTATTQTDLVDGFLLYVLATGLFQVVYCVLVGSFPFNSFLSGLFATVGVFVLTASLRLQLAGGRPGSVETAFAEYVFCSLILFLVVVNFIG